jgi:nucleoside-triphosphatase
MDNTKRKHILITGYPGVGKTTLIRRIADEFRDYHPCGFYTAEVREGGTRKGFELIGLDGSTAVLSHVAIKGSKHVGKYGVDIDGFEEFLGRLELSGHEPSIVVIDEIGKMECFSEIFITMIGDILGSEHLLIATIALKGGGIIADIKKRDDVSLVEVTRENRDHLVQEIVLSVRNVFQ